MRKKNCNIEGKEGVAMVGLELDPECGEDKEGFYGWVSGGRGGRTGRTVADLCAAGPEEVCQCDHGNNVDREQDRSLPCVWLSKKHQPTAPCMTGQHAPTPPAPRP